jgi:hypothetical protein
VLHCCASFSTLSQQSSLNSDGTDQDTVGMAVKESALTFLPLDDIAEDGNIELDETGPPNVSESGLSPYFRERTIRVFSLVVAAAAAAAFDC